MRGFLDQSQNDVKQSQCNRGLFSTLNWKLPYLHCIFDDTRKKKQNQKNKNKKTLLYWPHSLYLLPQGLVSPSWRDQFPDRHNEGNLLRPVSLLHLVILCGKSSEKRRRSFISVFRDWLIATATTHSGKNHSGMPQQQVPTTIYFWWNAEWLRKSVTVTEFSHRKIGSQKFPFVFVSTESSFGIQDQENSSADTKSLCLNIHGGKTFFSFTAENSFVTY